VSEAYAHTWLSANLPQSIIGILPRQSYLIFMRQVKIIDAADQFRNALSSESFGEGDDESGFADALEAIEADDEGWRRLFIVRCGVGLLV
jgi:hypothetical protein